MGESFKTWETKHTLAHAHEVQQRDAAPEASWDVASPSAYCIFMLFNLEAADDEGHCILALGPADGPLETYSYYRHSSKIEAPGIMACLKEPMSFRQLCYGNGWIVHGQPGNYWNEHVNVAIGMWCDEEAYAKARAYAQAKKADTGMYNLVTYNCLTFVDEALEHAGIHLTTKRGKPVRTFIPKDAFFEIDGVDGAHKFESWKFWFDVTKPPENGLRSINDFPGQDKPLE